MKSGLSEGRRTVPAGTFFKRGLLLGAGLLCAGRLWACGPFFPETILDADTPAVLAAPPGSLATELALLGQGRELPLSSCVHYGVAGSLPYEMAELRAVLLARGVEASACVRLVSVYEDLRRSEPLCPGPGLAQEAEQACPADSAEESTLASRESKAAEAVGVEAAAGVVAGQKTAGKRSPAALGQALAGLPAEMPSEFGLYLKGALAWRGGDPEQARQDWLGLLALPDLERKHRSVWAAYMLGRCALAEMKGLKGAEAARAGAEACRWFVQTRALAAQGFSDVAGLASESLGWEGQAALLQGDFTRALTCYYQQHRAGDETAFQSLRVSASKALAASPAELKKLAMDPLCRRLVTAAVVSRAKESVYDDYPGEGVWAAQAKSWCQALAQLPVGPLPEADHMAWLAYEAGDLVLAKNWLLHASEASPITWWLRAKITLREGGSREEAEAFYREALKVPGLDAGQLCRLQAELGRLCLARDEFELALAAWMSAGDWEAAAYVAERVMDTQALRAWVDARPAPKDETPGLSDSLRYLLARRLAREGSSEAAKYFSPALVPTYQAYLAQVRRAFDTQHAALARGRAFMAAARIVREQGMELLGTELAPDAFVYGGSFDIAERRRERVYGGNDPLAVSEAETDLLRKHPLPQQGRRFHYRYRAAELAWLGISLMPNDSEETAAMLCEAGSWLKHRDPAAADLYYKALVVRCPRTSLGLRAAELHWFPDLPEEQDEPEDGQSSHWGVRPGWLFLCWGLAIAVPLGMALARSRLRRRS